MVSMSREVEGLWADVSTRMPQAEGGSDILLTLVSRSLSEPGGQHAHGGHGDLRPFPQDALDVAVS